MAAGGRAHKVAVAPAINISVHKHRMGGFHCDIHRRPRRSRRITYSARRHRTGSEILGIPVQEIEQARRISPSIVGAMKNAGVFGMPMPRAWGGPELDPLTQFRVLEALSMADGSVGWCAMINCDGGYITAFLDQDVARVMYPDLQLGTAATATATGQALRVPGGYRVSGRFPFASGCHHCEWVWLGCIVMVDGVPVANAHGVPGTWQCIVKVSQCEILVYTWTQQACAARAAMIFLSRIRFLQAEHTFSFQDQNLIKRAGPLYSFPFMFVAKMSPVALGIARHALNVLIETATKQDGAALYGW